MTRRKRKSGWRGTHRAIERMHAMMIMIAAIALTLGACAPHSGVDSNAICDGTASLSKRLAGSLTASESVEDRIIIDAANLLHALEAACNVNG